MEIGKHIMSVFHMVAVSEFIELSVHFYTAIDTSEDETRYGFGREKADRQT